MRCVLEDQVRISRSAMRGVAPVRTKLASLVTDEFVAGTGNRNDQFRPLRIPFQLLAKACNMRINSSRERIRHITPNCLQQFLTRDGRSRTFNEVSEKLKFATRNIDWLPSSCNFGLLHVDNDRA